MASISVERLTMDGDIAGNIKENDTTENYIYQKTPLNSIFTQGQRAPKITIINESGEEENPLIITVKRNNESLMDKFVNLFSSLIKGMCGIFGMLFGGLFGNKHEEEQDDEIIIIRRNTAIKPTIPQITDDTTEENTEEVKEEDETQKVPADETAEENTEEVKEEDETQQVPADDTTEEVTEDDEADDNEKAEETGEKIKTKEKSKKTQKQ